MHAALLFQASSAASCCLCVTWRRPHEYLPDGRRSRRITALSNASLGYADGLRISGTLTGGGITPRLQLRPGAEGAEQKQEPGAVLDSDDEDVDPETDESEGHESDEDVPRALWMDAFEVARKRPPGALAAAAGGRKEGSVAHLMPIKDLAPLGPRPSRSHSRGAG